MQSQNVSDFFFSTKVIFYLFSIYVDMFRGHTKYLFKYLWPNTSQTFLYYCPSRQMFSLLDDLAPFDTFTVALGALTHDVFWILNSL